jgi:16S rRNA (uracil1498-N3)-methyltransferase
VIDGVRPLMPALEDLPAGTGVIFCDEAGDDEAAPWGGGQGRAKPLAGLLSALTEKPAAILVGPEGGFSPNERRMLRARKDTYVVSLGPRILRAETACIAALAVWQANENT